MRVSFPLAAEGGRIRVALAMLCAMALLAFAAAATPPSAHAAFTLNACQGGPTKGEGSSLQATAQEQVWTLSVFYTSFGCGSGAVSSSPVSYKSDGSGCGIASIGGGPQTKETCSTFQAETAKPGERASETRFAASDAPLTPTEKANAEAASGTNPGVLHQIPVAVAAVTVIVHFPEGCSLENPEPSGNGDTTTGGANDPGGKDGSGDSFAEETLRVHISATELEKIWEGEAVTWGDVLTSEAKVHISGTDTSVLNKGIACEDVPVRRIVRFDGSGTTYNFKAYLSLLPGAPSGLWTTAPVVGDNNNWPITAGGEKKQPELVSEGGGVCEDASNICTPRTGKGGPLAKAVAATDGSISYVDLATARKEKFSEEKHKVNNTYWIPLQTINPEKPEGERVGTNYVEPTAVPTAHIVGNGAALGANCTNADYRGLPTTPASDPTLGDWSNAIATGSTDSTTYPACAITYDLAFDDDAPVYGNTPLEQERARTVKDYLTDVESSVGQALVSGADYGVLPLSIQSIARAGVEAIGWDKAAGSGGGPKEVTPPATKSTPPPITGVTPPPVPSNVFSIASAKVKGKDIVLSLVLPDAGSVQVKATGGGVTVGSESASVSGGKGTVTLAISKSALSKLAKAKGHKLSVKITVTFTPTGGTAATQTKTLTVTQAAVTPPKKKASKKGKKK